MKGWRMRRVGFAVVCGVLLFVMGLAGGQETQPAKAVVVLASPRSADTASGTIWRYYETWRTDVARLDSGRLVRVDPYCPRVEYSPAKIWQEQEGGRKSKELQFPVQEAAEVTGSAFPPVDWTSPDFDDASWVRTATPMGSNYRALALVCLRGKFEVKDPAKVAELALDGSLHGGAIFYLNGREVGRAFLPDGKLDFETLAEDYPKETFVGPSGTLLRWFTNDYELRRDVQDPERQKRYQNRLRQYSVKVPSSVLRKGTNVLAVEVHRSPAREVMFTYVDPKEMGYNVVEQRTCWWNRASLEGLNLVAKGVEGAVVGNTRRPKGVQVWNWPAWERVDPRLYGDPSERLHAIRLCGARNGVFAGQVVVGSDSPIRGLEAEVTVLRAPGDKSIPASGIQVRFPSFYRKNPSAGFDPLESSPPAEVPLLPPQVVQNTAMQPVWVTVHVPRDAKPGDYSGSLTVHAEGLDPVVVPVELHVADWTLPDPQDFVTHMGFVQSPDSVALRYGVPMWSKEHWRLIERSFETLGRIATRELTIPLVRRTHFGNEHAMLWWVREDGGTLRPDFRIVERYITLAAKHLGKVPVVIFYVSEGEEEKTIPWITEFDPRTGELKEERGPRWGSEEARTFWKPAFEGFRKILAAHGMEKSLCLGYHAAGGNGPVAAQECIEDLKEVVPEARWVRLGHYWSAGHDFLERGPNGNPWARVALVANYGVYWTPGTDKPIYGWQNPYVVTAYTRGVFHPGSPLRDYRVCPEAILLSGQRQASAGWWTCDLAGMIGRETFLGARGFAPWGADFWPVLSAREGRDWHDIIARYNDPDAGRWDPRSSWSTVQLNNYQVTYIVGEGADGPVSTVRAEVLCEGLQEAEARVFVQNAVLDETAKTRLGVDLAGRCTDLCDERTRALRHLSEYTVTGFGKAAASVHNAHYLFNAESWQQESRRLYDLAAEAAKALGKN